MPYASTIYTFYAVLNRNREQCSQYQYCKRTFIQLIASWCRHRATCTSGILYYSILSENCLLPFRIATIDLCWLTNLIGSFSYLVTTVHQILYHSWKLSARRETGACTCSRDVYHPMPCYDDVSIDSLLLVCNWVNFGSAPIMHIYQAVGQSISIFYTKLQCVITVSFARGVPLVPSVSPAHLHNLNMVRLAGQPSPPPRTPLYDEQAWCQFSCSWNMDEEYARAHVTFYKLAQLPWPHRSIARLQQCNFVMFRWGWCH